MKGKVYPTPYLKKLLLYLCQVTVNVIEKERATVAKHFNVCIITGGD